MYGPLSCSLNVKGVLSGIIIYWTVIAVFKGHTRILDSGSYQVYGFDSCGEIRFEGSPAGLPKLTIRRLCPKP